MSNTLATVLGSFGAAALLWAYFVTSTRRRRPNELPVILANLAGSLLLIVNTYHFHAWPPLVVNTVWAVIAIHAIRRL
jgi:fluoride ion exporter CrcB/FEX